MVARFVYESDILDFNHNDEAYESARNAEFESFVKKNKLSNIDYAFVITGYVSRIVDRDRVTPDMLAVIPELIVSSAGTARLSAPHYVKDQTAYELIMQLPEKLIGDGGVLYKASNSRNAVDFRDMVCSLEYCNCFHVDVVEWHSVGGKTIMVVIVDTESDVYEQKKMPQSSNAPAAANKKAPRPPPGSPPEQLRGKTRRRPSSAKPGAAAPEKPQRSLTAKPGAAAAAAQLWRPSSAKPGAAPPAGPVFMLTKPAARKVAWGDAASAVAVAAPPPVQGSKRDHGRPTRFVWADAAAQQAAQAQREATLKAAAAKQARIQEAAAAAKRAKERPPAGPAQGEVVHALRNHSRATGDAALMARLAAVDRGNAADVKGDLAAKLTQALLESCGQHPIAADKKRAATLVGVAKRFCRYLDEARRELAMNAFNIADYGELTDNHSFAMAVDAMFATSARNGNERPFLELLFSLVGIPDCSKVALDSLGALDFKNAKLALPTRRSDRKTVEVRDWNDLHVVDVMDSMCSRDWGITLNYMSLASLYAALQALPAKNPHVQRMLAAMDLRRCVAMLDTLLEDAVGAAAEEGYGADETLMDFLLEQDIPDADMGYTLVRAGAVAVQAEEEAMAARVPLWMAAAKRAPDLHGKAVFQRLWLTYRNASLCMQLYHKKALPRKLAHVKEAHELLPRYALDVLVQAAVRLNVEDERYSEVLKSPELDGGTAAALAVEENEWHRMERVNYKETFLKEHKEYKTYIGVGHVLDALMRSHFCGAELDEQLYQLSLHLYDPARLAKESDDSDDEDDGDETEALGATLQEALRTFIMLAARARVALHLLRYELHQACTVRRGQLEKVIGAVPAYTSSSQ